MSNLQPRVAGFKPGRRDCAPRPWRVGVAVDFDLAALKGSALKVLLLLEGCARARSFCYPSNAWLADRAGVTVRTIQNALAELERGGWVLRIPDRKGRVRVRIGIMLLRRTDGRRGARLEDMNTIRLVIEAGTAPSETPRVPPSETAVVREERKVKESAPPPAPSTGSASPTEPEPDRAPPPTTSWASWWAARAAGQGATAGSPAPPPRRATTPPRRPWWSVLSAEEILADPILAAAAPAVHPPGF